MTPNDLRGQSSNVKVTMNIFGNKACELDRDFTVVYFFIKLARDIIHGERMDPIDFGGQRLKVKVTVDMCWNKLVNLIQTKPLCASSSNLADMLKLYCRYDYTNSCMINRISGQKQL